MAGQNYEKLLRIVGNAVAEEKDWPKPGSRVEYCEQFECHPGESGCSVPLGSAYLKASEECEKLRLAAEESGIKIDFDFGRGIGLLVKTDWKVLGWKKSFGYENKVVSRKHYFTVDGYRCKNAGALLDGVDSLDDVSGVEESFGPAERAELAFFLLDEICGRSSYNVGKTVNHPVGKNSERLLGLNEKATYSEMKRLAEIGRDTELAKMETSLPARIFGRYYKNEKARRIAASCREKLDKISRLEVAARQT